MKNNQNKFEFINTEYLYGVSNNNEFLKRIFSIFKEEYEIYAEKLPFFLSEKKYNDFAELIHKAKSSVAVLGMSKQAEELKALEKDVRQSINTDTYKQRTEKFISECKKAVEEIKILEKTF